MISKAFLDEKLFLAEQVKREGESTGINWHKEYLKWQKQLSFLTYYFWGYELAAAS